uniref:Uncharacterized protein n=1 Tax=Arundo donax TaxID=35708 RepID=A0A0A9TJA6_ARUDO
MLNLTRTCGCTIKGLDKMSTRIGPYAARASISVLANPPIELTPTRYPFLKEYPSCPRQKVFLSHPNGY